MIGKGTALISYSNFINTSKNTQNDLNNDLFGLVTISNSIFFNSCESFFTDSNNVDLISCISNEPISGFEPTITEQFTLNSLEKIRDNGICEIIQTFEKHFHHSISLSRFFVFLIFS